MLTGIGEGGKKCLIIWGISFLQLTRRPLWERNPSKKQRAIFCVRCVLLPGRQAKTISSPPARRSGTFGANAKDSGVPINDAVQKELCTVRDQLGLTQYTFPWEK